MTAEQTDSISVESLRYKDTRKNNPTPESAGAMAASDPDFARDSTKPHPDSAAAEKQAAELNDYLRGLMSNGGVSIQDLPRIRMMLDGEKEPEYPRLTWRKGEGSLRERTYGNLYTHDKVVPEEIIAGLVKNERFKNASLLFEPESILPPEAIFSPYKYEGEWSNRLVRATAQRAMSSLLYKDKMRGKVQLVYMDPPYNISFSSQFAATADSTSNSNGDVPPDAMRIRAFRDSYKDGVHSYLDGLKEQMELAKELLHESGSFVMQIGPDNLHQVAILMSEVFGSVNHVATIPYRTTTNPSAQLLPEIGNWLVWFAKDKQKTKYHQLYVARNDRKAILDYWQHRARFETDTGETRALTAEERADPNNIAAAGQIFMTYPCYSNHTSYTGRSDTYYHHGNDQPCNLEGWPEDFRQEAKDGPHYDHTCVPDECNKPLPENWTQHECNEDCDNTTGNRLCPKGRKCGPNCHATAYPCPNGSQWRVSLRGLHTIAQQRRITQGRNIQWKFYENELPGVVLNAIWENSGRVTDRQYIVQTPTRVLDRVLLMTTDPGDLVLDLTCGSGALPLRAEEWGRRWIAVDVSAISIAIARECLATNLYTNHLLVDSVEGAPIDHELEQQLWPPDKRQLFREKEGGYNDDPSRGFVMERQMRVSAKTLAYGPTASDIIRHQDRSTKSRQQKVRAASPFTVESDSPSRSIRPDQAQDGLAQERPEVTPTVSRICEALLKSGIRQAGRLIYKVEDLSPSTSRDVTHQATLVAVDAGDRKPAVFYIASEDETITTTRVGNAARHVMRNPDYADLVVVGFDRDAAALPESMLDAYAGVEIMIVEPSKDLHLPGLQHSASDNAFEIVSEPIVRLHNQGSGEAAIKVVGVNAYDPSNLNVRSPDVHHIMGILVDTEYDGNRFNTHLMNVVECDRNSRTLKGLGDGLARNLNENHFKRFKGKTTNPFTLPTDGSRVAVKVIDQTGIEHMKVLDVEDFRELGV